MARILIFLVFIGLTSISTSLAQIVRTPEKGSPERVEILNILRQPVERELKQKIVFSLHHFRVVGTWAFLGGDPQSPSGGEPNYRGTKYQSAKDADMFDNNIFALLRKSGGRWKVVTYAIGCTDVCYATWWRSYKAPKAVFPYTE